MDELNLNQLILRLMRAQAYKCEAPLENIHVNAEDKASDDGCDGWTDGPRRADPWLGYEDTCWQLKAGGAGEPSKIRGEIAKPIPRDTLARGGRFVLIASGSKSGKKGVNLRLKELVKQAAELGLPIDKINVFGSEKLSEWTNQHPAIAAQWSGFSEGMWSLETWSNSKEHQADWQASEKVRSTIANYRADLDFASDKIQHLHIFGPPGVGKTRFALELCRGSKWLEFVVYVRQETDVRLLEIIDAAVADVGVQLFIVADEVQSDSLRGLRDSVERGNGRIRLITIGHSSTTDTRRIPAYEVKPLEMEATKTHDRLATAVRADDGLRSTLAVLFLPLGRHRRELFTRPHHAAASGSTVIPSAITP